MIRKTDSTWLSATETWKADKTAAERTFGHIFTDKKIIEGLKKRFERLSEDLLAVCEA
jgi:hypothetical protein